MFQEIQRVLSTILHMNGKANIACNFNHLFKNEGLLKVMSSHVHCKRSNISEMVPDIVVVSCY